MGKECIDVEDMKFVNFLKEIAPYVIVVGSFARNEEHAGSDIDCFLRARPRVASDAVFDGNISTTKIAATRGCTDIVFDYYTQEEAASCRTPLVGGCSFCILILAHIKNEFNKNTRENLITRLFWFWLQFI